MKHLLNISGAKYSSIVKISEELARRTEEENLEYLMLNRGINQVVTIDLNEITDSMNFNSSLMQYYPPGPGNPGLRSAINANYFHNQSTNDNIYITAGGMNALYLTVSTLGCSKIYTPYFYWGAYKNLLKIHKKQQGFYRRYEKLIEKPEAFKNSAVIICDPNNPTGEKAPDELLLKAVERLNNQGVTVIWDSPYRKLFTNDNDSIYNDLAKFENVIITESFSKSVGLSGQRIGFMHSADKEFQKEFAVRLLFSGNGVNVFAQRIIEELLTSETGKLAVLRYKDKTAGAVRKNIAYLKEHDLVADELYAYDMIQGIFVILNKTEEALKSAAIGSVGLGYFVDDENLDSSRYARINTAVQHEKFVKYFDKFTN